VGKLSWSFARAAMPILKCWHGLWQPDPDGFQVLQTGAFPQKR
jgi:hypothetical protein